jgi:hypothetical protein
MGDGMAKNFVEAIKLMHAKMNSMPGAVAASDVDAKIARSQAQLIEALKTNPNLLKKMTGTGKPK